MERPLYPAAIHLFFRKNGEILLLRRFNTGYEDGNYSVVAGHIEPGESATQAGIREAKEEVGVRIDPRNLKIHGIMHRYSNGERIDFFAFVDTWEGEVSNMEPNKCDRLLWAHKECLPQNTIPYIRRALRLSDGQIWYDESGWEEIS
ncbi:MAG: NUDIX domain-containing protein [Ignavibacteria bacterium]|jgi:8-oxo-dGTP pyrophosphatase MutT (NUDIX family)|nr:NUDIX domain-containing protein [Ignavibacteria bacterium]MCU7504277.1 NUDIX domain-containing protein [Ignavibacteria bacterium]MCU7516122.1 NUDIX domain-containing protein [Ignavibacteria bacterium]